MHPGLILGVFCEYHFNEDKSSIESMEHIPCTLAVMQCAEIDGNATPSDFSVNYYIRVQ